MVNIVLFCLFNCDLFGNFNELYCIIICILGLVVLYFYVLYSYWLNFKSVVCFCEKVKNYKLDVILVWMLYDYWSVIGCCVFIDGCEGWKMGCQKCLILINYLLVKIDCVYQLVVGKCQLFCEMLVLGCQFIFFSQYVVDVFNSLYGLGCCWIINNGIDMVIEVILVDLFLVCEIQGKLKIVVVVYDLCYDGKINQ